MNYQKGNISVAIALLVVLLIIVFGVSALVQNNKNSEANALPSQSVAPTDTITNKTASKDTNTKKSMEPNNKIAKNGDTLVMNYTGKLTDGTVFDSNVDPKFHHVQPFEFTLGAGQVIKGWDEGLVGMKIGEKKTLTIPPEKGYGARGAGNSIPPNATLIFDVELVGIK